MTNPASRDVSAIAFLYAETPIHVGSGAGLGAIDLPIQRERMSRLPVIPGSGLKGALRELAHGWIWQQISSIKDYKTLSEADRHWLRWADRIHDLFGPPPPDSGEGNPQPSDFAGAVSIQDARLLLFPVRAARGGWAWLTSPMCIDRLGRDLETLGLPRQDLPRIDLKAADEGAAWIAPGSAVLSSKAVILEDLYFPATERPEVAKLAAWLKRALPAGEGYRPFAERLARQLVVVHDSTFTELAWRCTEVNTRVRLDPESRTVQKGALWTEEALPAESLMWSPMLFGRLRRQQDVAERTEKGEARRPQTKAQDPSEQAARDLLYLALGREVVPSGTKAVKILEREALDPRGAPHYRLRVGGDVSTGRGLMGLTLWAGEGA